jgi:hypothetical protein
VDFLVSGVFAAHFVNTVSPRFLEEIVEGRHDFVEDNLRQELTNKAHAECGTGILNAPDPAFNPGPGRGTQSQLHGRRSPASANGRTSATCRKCWDDGR